MFGKGYTRSVGGAEMRCLMSETQKRAQRCDGASVRTILVHP
jgi:hypothetical protein